MQQLHVEYSQLWDTFKCAKHFYEAIRGEGVTVAIGLLSRTAEMQFGQPLHSA
jgi:hypothetical protein